MTFSTADFPVQTPNAFGEIVEDLGRMGPTNRPATQAEILALVAKIDDSVANSCAVLDQILECEASWRTFVFQGKAEYDAEIEKHVEWSLKAWADGAESFLARLDMLRSKGLCPESLETLRVRVAEVRSILTPDDEFFEGEELDALTARAVAEDESGATAEFLVMGE